MATIRHLGRSAAGRAAAFRHIAPIFGNASKTVSGIFEKKEARERADAKIKREQPALDQASKIRGLKIGDLERSNRISGEQDKEYNIVKEKLLANGATEEQIEELGQKKVLEVFNDPFTTLKKIAPMMDQATDLDPEKMKVWEGVVDGSIAPPDKAIPETVEDRRAKQSQEAKDAAENALRPLLGGIAPEETEEPEPIEEPTEDGVELPGGQKILQPGERADVKPTTRVTKFPVKEENEEEELPANILKAQQFFEVLDELPGSYDNPRLLKTIEHHQKVLENFVKSDDNFGAFGASIKFSQGKEGKNLARKIKTVVAALRKQQVYSNELLDTIENQSDVNVIKANAMLGNILGSTEKATRTLKETTPGKVSLAAKTTSAKETAKRKTQYGLSADGLWDLKGTDATKLGNSLLANDAMQWMADKIDSGDVSWVDISKAGKLTDPKVRLMAKTIEEYYARPLSGAAINYAEWVQFREEIGLTKANLATKEGRAAASEKLRALFDNNVGIGATITKTDDWMNLLENKGSEFKISKTQGDNTEFKIAETKNNEINLSTKNVEDMTLEQLMAEKQRLEGTE